MAQNKVTFEVIVTDKGTQKIVIKDLETLGDSVERVGKRQKDADKSGKEFYDTQKKGIIGTANSTKSFSKLAETIGAGSSGVVGAYATLAANVFAVSAAFNALKNSAQVEQVMNGLEALGQRTGRTLSLAARSVQELSGYTLSAEQAMRSTAQVMSAGFNTAQLERITTAAKDASFALGRGMTDSMDRLTRGIIKLEPELLDELGIMTRIDDATSAYSVTIGKTAKELTSFERRTAFANAALSEAELKFGGLSDAAGNSKAFDQLAASFTDLTNTTLTFLNVAIKPLVGFLAGSPASLAGASIIFASTIASQLLPGLASLSKKSLEAANAAKELAKQQRAAARGESESAAKSGQKLIDAAKNSIIEVQKGPKAYNEYVASMKAGTATASELAKAQDTLARSLRAHEAQQKKMAANGEDTKAKDAVIDAIKKQQDALRAYATIDATAADQVIRNSDKVAKARNDARVAGLTAYAQERAALGLVNASQGKITAAFKDITAAVSVYHKAQVMANTSTVSGLATVKTAAFAASISVRALGAAFLNVIPIIGQIVFAAGLLYSAFKWVTKGSKEQQEFNKKMEELEEILSKVGSRAKEYERFTSSLAPASLRQAQAFKLVSNTVQEVVDAYEEAKAARLAMNAVDGSVDLGGTNKWVEAAKATALIAKDVAVQDWAKLGLDASKAFYEAFKSWQTGISKDSAFINFRASDIYKNEGFKAFKELYESRIPLIAKTARAAIEKQGGLDKIATLPQRNQVMAFAKALDTLQGSLAELGPATEALQGAFQELDKSTSTFVKSSVATTQYDKLILDFNNVNKSINGVTSALRSAQLGSGDLVDALSGIGSQAAQFLDPMTQKALSDVRKLDPLVQELLNKQKLLNSQGEGLSGTEQARLNRYTQQLAYSKSLVLTIESQLKAVSKQLLVAQEQERIGKNILALENARTKSIGTAFDTTGQGLRMQYEQEDKIRGIQVQQNNIQKNILELLVAKQRIGIQNLRTSLLELKAEAARERSLMTDSEKLAKAKELWDTVHEIENAQLSIRDLEASIKGLNLQNAALMEEQYSSAQKLSRIRERDVTVAAQITAKMNEGLAIQDDLQNTAIRMARIQTGRVDSLGDELNLLRVQRDASLRVAREQSTQTVAQLRATLEIQKADNARNAGNEDLVRMTESQIAAESALLEYKEAQIKAIAEADRMEKVLFDTRSKGLEWQQNSLDYITKSVAAQKELVDATQASIVAQTNLNLKRRGLELSDSGAEANEIRAAAAAYKLAVQEVSVKKSLIDLEYALLDAQKQQLREELSLRKSILESENSNGQYDSRIAQLNKTLENLSGADPSAIADNLKKALDVSLNAQRANLEAMTLPATRGNNTIISEMEGIRAMIRAREEARRALETKPDTRTIAKADPLSDSVKLVKDAEAKYQNTIVTSNTKLIDAINKWINAVDKQAANTPSQTLASGLQGNSKAAMEFFLKQGWSIAQAAGIVGNLQQESGKNLNTKAFNGTHVGIAQWDPARAASFAKMFGKEVRDATLEEQLKFIQHELETTHKTAGTLLKAANSAEEAAKAFEKRYEVAGGAAAAGYQNRLDNANKLVSTAEVRTAPAVLTSEQAKPAEDTKPIVVEAKASIDPMLKYLDEEIQRAKVPSIEVPVALGTKATEITNVSDGLLVFEKLTAGIKENLDQLGPEGAGLSAVLSGFSTITSASINCFEVLNSTTGDAAKDAANNFTAMATVAQAALSTIQSVLSASADAKISNIDREIAAEQKRDGKSAESVAKIQALEKKKDDIAKKQFNTNKKLMMAQAVISTAAGVAQALSYGPIAGPILAALIAAMGAAQIAIISGTSYQSTASSAVTASNNASLTIGKRGESVDLAKSNNNLGGELGYIRGQSGYGNNSSNYALVGSAYGGDLPRGYGNTAYMVGEKGPEILTPETPVSITPVNDNQKSSPISAEININAIDAKGMEGVLRDQRGNIISMLREAANSNGQRFLEDVDVNVYTRPNVGRL